MRNRAPLFGIVAAVLLGIGFLFLLYKPKVEEQRALETETATLENQAAALRSEIAQLEEVKANEPEIRAALKRLDDYIPDGDPAQPAALQQFQGAADAAGVEIDMVTFGEPTLVEGAPDSSDPETALAEIPVTMTVEGGYFQLVDLLRRLEVEEPRALLIDSVGIVEHEKKFPTLATTWTGKLFAIVPISAAQPPSSTTDPAAAAPDASQAPPTTPPATEPTAPPTAPPVDTGTAAGSSIQAASESS